MQPDLFGEIAGHPVGSTFPDRASLFGAGLHRQMQAGIAGAAKNGGAESIVLSGGYEDDKDLGDVIIYTGQGGQENGRQVADQELKLGNLALCRNHLTGLPVRVIRGGRHRSPYSPASGYRYDGLYQVADAWQASFGASKPATHRRLKTGHQVGGTGWKNRLLRTYVQGVSVQFVPSVPVFRSAAASPPRNRRAFPVGALAGFGPASAPPSAGRLWSR